MPLFAISPKLGEDLRNRAGADHAAAFADCEGGGVSADWLLGLSMVQRINVSNSKIQIGNKGGDYANCPLAKSAAKYMQR